MAFPKHLAEFFARHTERHPNGVIAGLLSDWERSQKTLPPTDPDLPPRTHNHDTPQRIARMLADRLRRRRP